ncbi:hypothetical protein [Lentzea nigeriaca]|uniref:hypothetical protein n=1 Tax=Lentzea nigeriaca TaxID=1128665 RepID=UPI00195BD018|nr:hypothetical protein [Lentzea nigeriaca]MBM7857075.1 hypothetical protein [Lentzea nigeriaca]
MLLAGGGELQVDQHLVHDFARLLWTVPESMVEVAAFMPQELERIARKADGGSGSGCRCPCSRRL